MYDFLIVDQSTTFPFVNLCLLLYKILAQTSHITFSNAHQRFLKAFLKCALTISYRNTPLSFVLFLFCVMEKDLVNTPSYKLCPWFSLSSCYPRLIQFLPGSILGCPHFLSHSRHSLIIEFTFIQNVYF